MKVTNLYFLTFLLALSSLSPVAQPQTIWAGTLIDPATGTKSKDQFITVEDGRILGITANRPEGAVIDLSNSYVMPGLMDCHVHLTYNDPVNAFTPPKKYAQESTSERAMRGLYNAGLLLQAGFTTVKEIGKRCGVCKLQLYEKAIANGWFDGPTIVLRWQDHCAHMVGRSKGSVQRPVQSGKRNI